MNKNLQTILILIIILTVFGAMFIPNQVEAACVNFTSVDLGECFVDASAIIGNLLLTFVAFFLNITSIILSYSIKLTLSIGQIYKSTPAIENVWVIVRNISSMFIIFILLFSSIKTILGIGDTGLKKLVFSIIAAGLLINFSLFFTKTAIDASNLISLQFYRAIAPNSSLDLGALSDGGLSSVFLSSLKLQRIYDPESSALANNTGKSSVSLMTSVAIATYGGAILMLFAAISFLGAAAAFTIRTGVLLLLMAFSPIYFAGMIFPKIKSEVSDKWFNYLTNQLLFMPVYLLLMYVALKIISDAKFLSFIQGSGDLVSNQGSFLYSQAGIVIQYVIAIFLINIPLIAAIKFGAIGAGFASKLTDGLKSNIFNTPGFLGQHTLGRGAKRMSEALAKSDLAVKNPNFAVLANKALGGVSGATYGGTKGGYDKRFKDYTKERTDYAKKIKLNDSDEIKVRARTALGIMNYDAETANLRTKLRQAEENYRNFTFGPAANEKLAAEWKAESQKIKSQIDDRTNPDKRKKELEKIKDDSKKQVQDEKVGAFASNLSKKGRVWTGERAVGAVTSAANKEAADAIRKEMSKGKDKKVLDAIKEFASEDKPEKSEDKPKP